MVSSILDLMRKLPMCRGKDTATHVCEHQACYSGCSAQEGTMDDVPGPQIDLMDEDRIGFGSGRPKRRR
jgi:hypothetical protein